MARQRFREGVQFYDQRQYEKARLAFLQAYALKPHPSVLLNLAQSELRADRPDDAANHFSEYLRGSTQGDAERQEAESGFLVAKAKTGEITVTAEPSGAQVIVDGQDKGAAPLAGPVYVVPGSHTVEVRSSERKTSKVVVVGAGQATAVALSARAAASEAQPAPSGAPLEEDAAPAEPAENTVEAEVSTSNRRSLPAWFADTPLAWVGAGLAVAGFATGGTFAGLATREYGTANNTKARIDEAFAEDTDAAPELLQYAPCRQPGPEDLSDPTAKGLRSSPKAALYDSYCAKFQDHADKGDKYRTIAIIGTAVGGAALIGTIVYYFVDSEEPATTARAGGFRARLVPGTVGTMNGLSVVGQF